MNMIMTPARAARERELLADELVQRIVNTVNFHLVSGMDRARFWSFECPGEQLFPTSCHAGIWSAPMTNRGTVGQAVSSKINLLCSEAGYKIDLVFNDEKNILYGSVSQDSLNWSNLSILDFAEFVLSVKLHPGQKALLKALYKDTEFNENLALDGNDIRAVQRAEPYGADQHTILKMQRQSFTNGFSVRIGRRGGRTLISTICALYEFYRLAPRRVNIGYFHRHDSRILKEFLPLLENRLPHFKMSISHYGNQDFNAEMIGPDATATARLIVRSASNPLMYELSSYITDGMGDVNPYARSLQFLDENTDQRADLSLPAWVTNPNLDVQSLEKLDMFDKIYGAR